MFLAYYINKYTVFRILIFNIMDININEVYRYLGYRNNTEMVKDPETDKIINEVCEAINNVCHPKALYRVFPFEFVEDTIRFNISLSSDSTDFIEFKSKALNKHLKNCKELILFAATLGPEADQLVRRFSITSMAHASVAQAAGAAAIESFADEECKKISELYPYTKPRFSPGYSDFALSHQLDFERILQMRKNLGITLGDSLLMTPSKSITAVIGISDEKETCVLHKCQGCTKTNCEFRSNII